MGKHEEEFKVGNIIIFKSRNGTPMIARIKKVESLISDPEENIEDWPILSVVFEDGNSTEISTSESVIPISIEQLEILIQQAKDLSKQSSPKPNGRHPDSCPP